MDLLQILVLLVIAGICGSVAELIVGFSPGGFLVSIVIGLIGAYLGSSIGNRIGGPLHLTLQVGNQPFDIIWAIIGSILLLVVISFLRGGRGRRFIRRR